MDGELKLQGVEPTLNACEMRSRVFHLIGVFSSQLLVVWFFFLPMKVRRAFSWKLGVSIIAFISPKGSTSRPGTQVAKMADEQKMETKNKAQVLRCEAVKTPKVLKMSQKVFTILLMETTYCTFALEFANCIIAAFWAWCGQSCR